MFEAGVRIKTATAIEQYLLPLGILVFLTGMFWVGSRSGFRSLVLLCVLIPSLLLVVVRPSRLALLWAPRLGKLTLIFLAYVAYTVTWSDQPEFAIQAKRLLYLVLFMLCVTAAYVHERERVTTAVAFATVVAALSATVSVVYFYGVQGHPLSERLPGFGALYNPLLSSHVYGSFAALMIGTICALQPSRQRLAALLMILAPLLGFVLLTQSRTPLLALAVVIAVQLIANPSRHSRFFALALAALVALGLLLFYDTLIEARGSSRRFEIWLQSWNMYLSAPLLGHGHDSVFQIEIPGAEQIYYDPHNIPLAVLFYTGAVGFVVWALIHIEAFRSLLARSTSPHALAVLGILTYGVVAGLMEGGDYVSRAKEHWYLIWWPIACVLALTSAWRRQQQYRDPATVNCPTNASPVRQKE